MGTRFGFTAQDLTVKLPLPPDTATLRAVLRPEDLVTYFVGTELWHVYKRGGAHPVHSCTGRHNALRSMNVVATRCRHILLSIGRWSIQPCSTSWQLSPTTLATR